MSSGDVSGRGMPAAMSVSLLVGTLRVLAHYPQTPGEILAAINQRMLARCALSPPERRDRLYSCP